MSRRHLRRVELFIELFLHGFETCFERVETVVEAFVHDLMTAVSLFDARCDALFVASDLGFKFVNAPGHALDHLVGGRRCGRFELSGMFIAIAAQPCPHGPEQSHDAAGSSTHETASMISVLFVASGLFYVGVCYWWPSMLGIVAERFPKTGAMGLAIIGGVGNFGTTAAGPFMGWVNDNLGPESVLPVWSILPLIIFVVFAAMWATFWDMGGYRPQQIEEEKKAA